MEFRRVIEADPEGMHRHKCREFSGISSAELGVRENTVKEFGVSSMAYSLAGQTKRSAHVAYTEEELSKMKRYALRKTAESQGLSMAESGKMDADGIRDFILQKQGGKKGTKAKGKAKTSTAEVVEDEPQQAPGRRRRVEPEEEEEEEPAPAGGNKMLEAIGHAIDKMEEKQDLANAVLDRKINIVMGAIELLGKEVIGEDFDVLDVAHEENFLKNKQYAVKLGALQASSPHLEDLDGEEEEA